MFFLRRLVPIVEIIKLKSVLTKLRQQVNDIEGCTVVSRDGLIIASELRSDVVGKEFAALSVDVTKSGEIVASELRMGSLSQIVINSSDGNIITATIGKKAVLACLVQKKASIGFVLLHMNRAADYLARLLVGG